MERFGPWLPCRVAQAVEAGDVPGNLLTELQAELEAMRERPRGGRQTATRRHVADPASWSEEVAAESVVRVETHSDQANV